VLVPGLTDDPGDVDNIAAFVSTLSTVERVEVLPFHKLGAAKYTALGIPFHTPTPDHDLAGRGPARDVGPLSRDR
jgi:pyruvate formate lyase activating enzyme